jgi:hypothetical protein
MCQAVTFKRRAILAGAGTLALLAAPAFAQGPVPLGELFASDANGPRSVQLAGSGMDVVSGSELSAGIAPATLRLFRGGQVRICPRSGLSVSTGGNGLMLASGTGALEIDYQLTAQSVDVLITPDFNVTIVGPAAFHFALGVNKEGDTCVKPLPGNAGEISFSELQGAGIYKTRADEAALFPGGKINGRAPLNSECGCPPAMPVVQAEAQPPPAAPAEPNTAAAQPRERVAVASSEPASSSPPDHPGQVHVEVDAPFVFSARSSAAQPYSVAKLQVSSLPNLFFVQEEVDPVVLTNKMPVVSPKAEVQPQPVPEKKEKKGFFGRVKGFFGSLFHR